jgi:carbonic anhydrase
MASIDTLTGRNQSFADGFDQGHLGIPPKLGTLILTCVDTRVDPAHYFGLQLGDSFVLRNAGARVTASVINDIAVLSYLVKRLQGPDSGGLQVLVIPHTKCGMQNFSAPDAAAALAEATGVAQRAIAEIAITTPQQSVLDDIDRLRQSSLIDDSTVVGGYVYDVETGRVTEVAPPAPLG